MDYLPFVFVAVIALFMALPLFTWIGSKRMQGNAAPAHDDLLAPGQVGRERLLFYFYSEHCGPCRSMGPVLDRLGEQHGNVVKVDVMQRPEAARRFGIRATPTLMLVEGGRVVKVMLGSVSGQKLEALLR